MRISQLLLGLVAAASLAHAGIIVYTDSVTANGIIGSTQFTDARVTLMAIGNTADVTNPSSQFYELTVPAFSINIAGVGTYTVTNSNVGTSSSVFARQGPNCPVVGITPGEDILDTNGFVGSGGCASGTILFDTLLNYALTTPVDVTGYSSFGTNIPVSTNGGTFEFTGPLGTELDSTFTATVPLLPDPCPQDADTGDCFFGYNFFGNNPTPMPPPGYYWAPLNTVYDFPSASSGSWFDPANAYGYAYEMTGSSLFTSVVFPTGFNQPFVVTAAGCTIPMTFTGGQTLDFVALCGQGVSGFDITNISPSFDPTNPGAFPVSLTFNTPTANFVATALDATPEPATVAMAGIALAGLAAFRYRRSARKAARLE